MPTVLHDLAWLVNASAMVRSGDQLYAVSWGWSPAPRCGAGRTVRTEVHNTTVATQVLRGYQATDRHVATEWMPRKLEAAPGKVTPTTLETEVGTL